MVVTSGTSGSTAVPVRAAKPAATVGTSTPRTRMWSHVSDSGNPPPVGNAPAPGLRPTTPHSAAGVRTEQPVSVPSASGTRPAAMAAAEPPEDPPVIRDGSCGLWQGPCTAPTPGGPQADSLGCVFP